MTSRLGRIPTTWWLESALAGLAGGLAMALAWDIGSAVVGDGFWTPLNILGLTLGDSTSIPTTFGSYTLGGVLLHLMTAMCWGIVFSAVIGLGFPDLTRSVTKLVLSGLAFGVVTFVLMGEFVAPRINPDIMSIHSVSYFVGHLIFGVVTALLLYAASRRHKLSVTFAPELAVHHHQAPSGR
jgi:hypothetical protein